MGGDSLMTEIIKVPKTVKEKKISELLNKIRNILEPEFKDADDIEAGVNSLITLLAFYTHLMSMRNDLIALEWADRIKSAIIDYHVMMTKDK